MSDQVAGVDSVIVWLDNGDSIELSLGEPEAGSMILSWGPRGTFALEPVDD